MTSSTSTSPSSTVTSFSSLFPFLSSALGHTLNAVRFSLRMVSAENKRRAILSFSLGLVVVLLSILFQGPSPVSHFESVSLKRVAHLSPTCEALRDLPYRPANGEHGVFSAFGLHAFVFVSSHRLSAREFSVVGLSAKALHESWGAMGEGCLWVAVTKEAKILKPINGKLEYFFPGEEGDAYFAYGEKKSLTLYESVVIRCYLEKATPATAGSLFYNMQGELALLLREDFGVLELNPPSPLPHSLAFCSTLISHKIREAQVLEHLQYLRYFGFTFFYLYDGGGVDEEMRRAIEPFVRANMLEVVDVRGLTSYSADHDTVVVNDCAYRSRFLSQWTLFSSLEEYPFVEEPFRLAKVLKLNAGRPWMTMGAYDWHIELCAPPAAGSDDDDDSSSSASSSTREWLVERMIFRWPTPHCSVSPFSRAHHHASLASPLSSSLSSSFSTTGVVHEGGMEEEMEREEREREQRLRIPPELCLGVNGKRRVLFDPRQTSALLPHSVAVPSHGGTHLNTTVMHVNRYFALAEPASLVCDYHILKGQEPHLWKRRTAFSKLIHSGKRSRLIGLPQRDNAATASSHTSTSDVASRK